METKEPIKIKLSMILIIIGAIILIGILLFVRLSNSEQEIEQYYINGKHYIQQEKDRRLGISTSYKLGQVINNYTDYINMFTNNSEVLSLLQNVVNQNFFNTKSLIVLEDSTSSVNGIDGHISKININDNIANITIKRDEKEYGVVAGDIRTYFIPIRVYNEGESVVAGDIRTYFIPIDNKQITEVNREYKFPFDIWDIINPLLMISPFIMLGIAIIKYIKTKNKLKNTIIDEDEKKSESKKALKKLIKWIVASGIWGFILESIHTITSLPIAYKPIIYLYPEKDKEVSVELGYKDNITISYPKYTNGWNVFAQANGNLTDLDTNKNLYSLYYESKNTYNFKIENDGFIIKRDNVSEFLENKLSILGLTDREKEEFIIYWLPILQKNKYNYIRFATIDEINKNMPLEINPNPDTLIRILMTFKGLEKPIDIAEQQLVTPERTGFVAVEWGGTEIK